MKKSLILTISSLMIIAFLSSCSDTKLTKTGTIDPQVKSGSGDSFAIDEINRQVKGFSIDGFPGGSSKLAKTKDLKNMEKIVGLAKPIIAQIPDGYVMQITGHCADYESVAEQKRVSTDRAGKVYSELKKAGVAAKKMSYKGVGVDEPLESYSGKDAKQRCVTFRALKK